MLSNAKIILDAKTTLAGLFSSDDVDVVIDGIKRKKRSKKSPSPVKKNRSGSRRKNKKKQNEDGYDEERIVRENAAAKQMAKESDGCVIS